jgi:long-subunit acyl-CoA synthetase (AMP-forming)
MIMAHSCFTQNLLITTAYDTLGEKGLAFSLNEGEVPTYNRLTKSVHPYRLVRRRQEGRTQSRVPQIRGVHGRNQRY